MTKFSTALISRRLELLSEDQSDLQCTSANSKQCHGSGQGHRGFTLIELMITVAIIAILATIALPSYNSYVREGRRSDAYSALSNIALQQEKYRANNTTYGTLAQIGVSADSPDKHYAISIDAATLTASGYVAVATALSTSSQAGDKQGSQSCSTLTLTVAGGIPAYTPAACWKK